MLSNFIKYHYIFSIYFIDCAITVVPIFSPLSPTLPCIAPPDPPAFPSPLSSCPWVIHISSLNFLFSIPFFISPHVFYAY